MKILFLTRYGLQGASSRMRSFQYLPWFESADVECIVAPLFDDEMLLQKYRHGNYGLLALLSAYWRRIHVLLGRDRFDLIWIEKEAFPWLPAWFERLLLRHVPYVLDFDDAIFHNYDMHKFSWVRYLLGRKIDHLMSGAHLVVAGNEYLSVRAKAAGARWVEVVPTVIDLARYLVKKEYSVPIKPRIVWIGSPSSTQYLRELTEALVAVSKLHPFTLRVIGGDAVIMPGIDVEVRVWSAETEAAAIAECDIGIMPLKKTPWEQGKCAYKLIQYMACGLPTVASPIGANRNVVIEGKTGLFADSKDAWVEVLATLLRDAPLRQRFGQAGRVRIEAEYCLQQTAPRMVTLLKKAITDLPPKNRLPTVT